MLLALIVALFATGCAKKARVPKPARIGKSERGVASWYGNPYHGRRSANGEIYDMEKFTAAHRTLPFETWVHVRNLDNGKAVDVRITDRGPFVRGRIIDLSRAAARQIDMLGPGLASVRIEVIRPPKQKREVRDLFGVQVGAFLSSKNAGALRSEMERAHGRATVLERDGSSKLYRVVVGEFPTEADAAALAERLRARFDGCVVVRLDGRTR